jgi:hypothetical protein
MLDRLVGKPKRFRSLADDTLYLMWCIWREQNVRCFENRETSVIELKNIMVKSFYTWIATYNSPHLSSFFFFFSSLVYLLYVRVCILVLRPSTLLMELIYL